MKRILFLSIAILLIISMTLTVSYCSKSEPADELIAKINRSPLGLHIKTDKANTIVQSTGERHVITFKDPAVTIDYSVFRDWVDQKIKPVKIPIAVKEVTFLYGPKEKFLELVSIKGLGFQMDKSQLLEKNKKPEFPFDLGPKSEWKAENASFKNHNLSPLLTYKGKDPLELLEKIVELSQNSQYVVERGSYEFQITSDENKTISVLLAADKMEAQQRALSKLLLAILKKDSPAPDFSKPLQQGVPIADVSFGVINLKILVKENDRDMGGGVLGNMSMSFYLKPDDARSAYNFGGSFDLKDLKLSIPGNPKLESLMNLYKMGMTSSLDNLSPGFIKAYFDLTRMAMKTSDTGNKEEMQQKEQLMMTAFMNLGSEFTKSKPVLKLKWSPFKTSLFECSVEANIQFPSPIGPAGIATVKILKMNEGWKKLKAMNIIPSARVQEVERSLKKIFVVDKNGDANLTFELKADQPGKYFMNGKAQSFISEHEK